MKYYMGISGSIVATLIVLYMINSKFKESISIKKLIETHTNVKIIKDKQEVLSDTSIIVHNSDFYKQLITRGELGLAESYMDGYWKTPNLEKVIYELMENNKKLVNGLINLEYIYLGAKTYLLDYLPNNTIKSSRENIKHHYDIGNDLYEKMLGKHMLYTCAYFKDDTMSLDDAQYAKMELIAKKLNLKPGQKILDIGCGFGSLAVYLADKYNVTVDGVTISEEQIKYYTKHYNHPSVTIHNLDYRNMVGSYDRIYSIGMFEHVGRKNYKTYFDKCYELLKDDGIMLLHTIGANNAQKKSPFISKYIFPEGELPKLTDLIVYNDKWHLEDLQNIGKSYSKTLRKWYENIGDWSGLNNYDDRFRRMWEFYLLSCSAGFDRKKIYLWQLVYTKTTNKGYDCYYLR